MVGNVQEWRLKRFIEGKARPWQSQFYTSRGSITLKGALETIRLRFSSYGQVQQWLEQECGVTVVYYTVHSLMRYKLQAKLKKPRPKSHKQNPQAVEQF